MAKYNLRMWDRQWKYLGDGHTRLLSTAEVVEYRSGGDPSTSHKLPGRMKYDEITLERGVAHDSAFANWAAQVMGSASSPGSGASSANFRKDIYVEFYNEAGQLVVSYRISGGWVTEHLTQRGLLLHNLQLHDGKTVREKLAAIFEASLSRS